MRRLLLLLFFITSASLYISPAVAQDTLTVMTYNIYHGEQAYQDKQGSLQVIADLIKREDPDLVALQEVDSLTGRSASLNQGTPLNQIKKLASLTSRHGYFAKAIDYDGGGYGEGILTKKSLPVEKVMLPNPREGEKRALLIVEYPLKQGKKLLFGGTHLDHQMVGNRIAQVQKINEYFSSVEHPVVVAGDFNFTPGEKPYQLMSYQWLDAAAELKLTEPTFPSKEPSARIDYIFMSKGKDVKWELIDMQVLKEDHSDHRPVVLTFIIHKK